MIFHATFVSNALDKFHAEHPQLTFAMRQEEDTFILVLDNGFNMLPALDRVTAFHAINDLLNELSGAGIKVKLEARNLL